MCIEINAFYNIVIILGKLFQRYWNGLNNNPCKEQRALGFSQIK